MHVTEIRVDEGDLLEEMARMREWLDRRRFEPSVFRYDHAGEAVFVRIEFTVETEAAAFAARFGGQLLS